MNIICKQLNPHSCKTYLIGIQGKNEVVLIDPVLDHAQEYLEMLEKNNYKLSQVIDTHTHADHISGAAVLKDVTGCLYAMHGNAPAQCPDQRIADGDELFLLDEIPVKVLYTPGHTRDSISLIFPDWIFTGDALFLDDGGAGRDDLPGGDPGAHWETLKKISELDENLVVYPAHDYRDKQPSPLKQQKETNPHLKERTKEEFIQYLNDLKLGPADWMKDVLKANYACATNPKAAWIPADSPACEVKGTLDLGVNEIKVEPISASDLKQELGSDTPPLLIDVREEQELTGELGHIEGIIHIPIGSLAGRLNEIEGNREIVTVCRSGGRAHTAAQILIQAGFLNVKVLNGGMQAWNSP
jgi:glyoxylase-like metal-dependent hydrolase (beta-lactamase superfamily II)/rhodanese-related sulfurtransferase